VGLSEKQDKNTKHLDLANYRSFFFSPKTIAGFSDSENMQLINEEDKIEGIKKTP